MTLFLDHVQRLNVIALLGLQECNVGETRSLWKLIDTLSLDNDEKETIGFFTQSFNGDEVQGWDQNKSLPPKTYDLADGDVARIRRAIQTFPRHRVAMARRWLEPLMEQLPVEEETDRKVASFARG